MNDIGLLSRLPRLVRCGCGHELWAEDIEDLRTIAAEHVQRAHPELANTLSPLELARPRETSEGVIAA